MAFPETRYLPRLLYTHNSRAGLAISFRDLHVRCHGRHTRSRHVGPETQSSNVNDQIIRTKIVEDVPLCLVCEDDIARHCHQETTDECHPRRCVGDSVESAALAGVKMLRGT